MKKPKYQKVLEKYQTHLLLLIIALICAFGMYLALETTFNEFERVYDEYHVIEQKTSVRDAHTVKMAISEAKAHELCSLDAVVCDDEPVEDRIAAVARAYDFDADKLIGLAKCESGLDPSIWNTTTCTSCRGLYQWHQNSLSDDQCALDVECSTSKTIEALQRGEQWRWPNCTI